MAIDLVIPPAGALLAGAVVVPLLPPRFRSVAFLVFPLLGLIMVWTANEGTRTAVYFLNYELVPYSVDQLSRVFGLIFCIIAFAGGVYAFHEQEAGHKSATLVYAGSALGVTFAGDLFTLIVFWELMAISSTYLVWARRTREAQAAGMRYLLVHLFGGSLLIAGVLLHLTETQSLAIGQLTLHTSPASWLILAGVVLNAAVPPLHAWLPDAYTRATVSGAVFLSAFTTKSAVYVLARVYPGLELLVFLGVMMALYGVVFAVLANDIRDILAYHIISQVGYMVAGVGIGTPLALNGTVAHAFSHILYKALLFMGAGTVLHTTGRSKLTELGGLIRYQPITFWLYMIGAFSISGFPLFNGFISKSIIVSAAGEAHREVSMLLLSLASVGTFLHTGLKLPYFTWFSQDRGLLPHKAPATMHIGMLMVGALCVLFGIAPDLLYRLLPFEMQYQPYTLSHLTETTQILLFTFLAFWIFRVKLAGEPTITLDTDWVYRRPAGIARKMLVAGVGFVFDYVEDRLNVAARILARWSVNPRLVLAFFNPQRATLSPSAFDPDEHRGPVGTLLGIVFGCVVVIALLGLVWIGSSE